MIAEVSDVGAVIAALAGVVLGSFIAVVVIFSRR